MHWKLNDEQEDIMMYYDESLFQKQKPKITVVLRNKKNADGFDGPVKSVADLVIASLDGKEIDSALNETYRTLINAVNSDGLSYCTITNEIFSEGSVNLFVPGVLDKVSEKWQKSFVCIPVSIHEWMLLKPEDFENHSIKYYQSILSDMRKFNHVMADEVLSDNIYFYDGMTKKFDILSDVNYLAEA